MTGIVLAALLWGTTGTAAALLPAGVGPLATGATALGVGGLLLALTAPRATGRVLRARGSWRWLVPGGLALAVYPLAFYSSMSLAGVAVGNVVSLGTAPLFAALLERVVLPRGERPGLDRRWLVSAGAAVAGVALLATHGHAPDPATASGSGASGATDEAGAVALGVVLGLVAGLTYAGYTVTTGRLIAGGASSRGAMAAHFAVGATVLVPVVVVVLGGAVRSGAATAAVDDGTPLGAALAAAASPPAWAVLAYLVLGPVVLAYLAFGRGLRSVPGSRATTVTLLEPFVATLLAVVAVGERLAPLGWLGLALVLAGVVSVATDRRGSPRRLPPEPAPA